MSTAHNINPVTGYTEAYEHAVSCGINMTGKIALPVAESAGYLVMVDIIHPVTLEPVIHAGTTMDVQLVEHCEMCGVDYVIVYKQEPVSRDLTHYACHEILQELVERCAHTNGLEFCSKADMYLARGFLTERLQELREQGEQATADEERAIQLAAFKLVFDKQ
jgi:hypothetical protein